MYREKHFSIFSCSCNISQRNIPLSFTEAKRQKPSDEIQTNGMCIFSIDTTLKLDIRQEVQHKEPKTEVEGHCSSQEGKPSWIHTLFKIGQLGRRERKLQQHLCLKAQGLDYFRGKRPKVQLLCHCIELIFLHISTGKKPKPKPTKLKINNKNNKKKYRKKITVT